MQDATASGTASAWLPARNATVVRALQKQQCGSPLGHVHQKQRQALRVTNNSSNSPLGHVQDAGLGEQARDDNAGDGGHGGAGVDQLGLDIPAVRRIGCVKSLVGALACAQRLRCGAVAVQRMLEAARICYRRACVARPVNTAG